MTILNAEAALQAAQDEYDQANLALSVAQARVTAATSGLATCQANLVTARTTDTSEPSIIQAYDASENAVVQQDATSDGLTPI